MASKTEEQMKNLFSDRIVTCPVCGKQFIREVNHLYKVRNNRKDNTLYFCRYTHWMQWKRDHGRH